MKKKTTSRKTRSSVAIAATVLAIPLAGGAQEAAAQKPKPKPTANRVVQYPDTTVARLMIKNLTVKMTGNVRIVGLDSGRIVYENNRNEQFYLDPRTGDIRYIASQSRTLQGVNIKQTLAQKEAAGHKDAIGVKHAEGAKDTAGVKDAKGVKHAEGVKVAVGVKDTVGVKDAIGVKHAEGVKVAVGVNDTAGVKDAKGVKHAEGVKDAITVKDAADHKNTRADKFAEFALTIIGTDKSGNILHRMSSGDVFFLDPVTGDMVFVK